MTSARPDGGKSRAGPMISARSGALAPRAAAAGATADAGARAPPPPVPKPRAATKRTRDAFTGRTLLCITGLVGSRDAWTLSRPIGSIGRGAFARLGVGSLGSAAPDGLTHRAGTR